MKKILIAASFGTTFLDTLALNIGAVEQHLSNIYTDWEVRRAFTSSMVVRALAKKGLQVKSVPEVLEEASLEGFQTAVILPTHLLYGEEYEKLSRQAEPFQSCFASLNIAKPLLAGTQEIHRLAGILDETFPYEAGCCIVLVGHGTKHHANFAYAALEYTLRQQGRNDMLVGTVEAYPGVEQVLYRAEQGGFAKALLTPLMLVAGDHAVHDIAGDAEGSWKSKLRQSGLSVEVLLRGLGELPAVRSLYAIHAAGAMG